MEINPYQQLAQTGRTLKSWLFIRCLSELSNGRQL